MKSTLNLSRAEYSKRIEESFNDGRKMGISFTIEFMINSIAMILLDKCILSDTSITDEERVTAVIDKMIDLSTSYLDDRLTLDDIKQILKEEYDVVIQI